MDHLHCLPLLFSNCFVQFEDAWTIPVGISGNRFTAPSGLSWLISSSG